MASQADFTTIVADIRAEITRIGAKLAELSAAVAAGGMTAAAEDGFKADLAALVVDMKKIGAAAPVVPPVNPDEV